MLHWNLNICLTCRLGSVLTGTKVSRIFGILYKIYRYLMMSICDLVSLQCKVKVKIPDSHFEKLDKHDQDESVMETLVSWFCFHPIRNPGKKPECENYTSVTEDINITGMLEKSFCQCKQCLYISTTYARLQRMWE